MSSKDIEKKFVGQPIFKQIIAFIPKNKFDLLAKKHQTDPCYKAFSSLNTTRNDAFWCFEQMGFDGRNLRWNAGNAG